jgi:hypothetical protein
MCLAFSFHALLCRRTSLFKEGSVLTVQTRTLRKKAAEGAWAQLTLVPGDEGNWCISGH